MTDAREHHRLSALAAALANRCPRCGEGRILHGFLTPIPRCENCGADFTKHDAGDGATFIVLTLLCFLVMGAVVTLEFAFRPPFWVHAVVGVTLTAGLAALLLPVTKRFMIAQSLRMDAGQGEADRAQPSGSAAEAGREEN